MRFFLLVSLCLLSACSSIRQATLATEEKISDLVHPYRLDIRQGNYLTQEMVAQLKPGLSRDQVRFILGTPLVADPFHNNRWDYVYSFRTGHEAPQSRKLIVYFDGNKLASLGGDVAALEPGAASQEASPASQARVIDITPDPNGPKTEPDIKIPPREDEEEQRKKGKH